MGRVCDNARGTHSDDGYRALVLGDKVGKATKVKEGHPGKTGRKSKATRGAKRERNAICIRTINTYIHTYTRIYTHVYVYVCLVSGANAYLTFGRRGYRIVFLFFFVFRVSFFVRYTVFSGDSGGGRNLIARSPRDYNSGVRTPTRYATQCCSCVYAIDYFGIRMRGTKGNRETTALPIAGQ